MQLKSSLMGGGRTDVASAQKLLRSRGASGIEGIG